MEYFEFSTIWKIDWEDFDSIPYQSRGSFPTKSIFTSFNNIPLAWTAEFSKNEETLGKVQFHLIYMYGPWDMLEQISFTTDIINGANNTFIRSYSVPTYDAQRAKMWGWNEYCECDSIVLQQRYGLSPAHPFVLRLTIKVQKSAFTYTIDNPLPTVASPAWYADLFSVIQDPARSTFSDIKFISGDETVFYCHSMIAHQSPELQAMIRHADEGAPGEFKFPTMGDKSLKAFIEYLYTGGVVDLDDLASHDLLDLADAAEQYNLQPLKQACVSILHYQLPTRRWSGLRIMRFAHLHNLPHLKYRAMDVLVDQFANLDRANPNSLISELHGGLGTHLLRDFFLFCACRVEPDIQM